MADDDKPPFDPSRPFQSVDLPEWAREPKASSKADDWSAFQEVAAKPAPSWSETALDVAKQIPSGIAVGAQAALHAGPSAMSALGHGVDYLLEKSGLQTPAMKREAEAIESRRQAMESIRPEIADVLPTPTTLAGERARNISEFAPLAVTGPGGLASKAVQAVVPGVASQAAGELTQGTQYEPYARLGAAVLGGIGGAKTSATIANSVRSKAIPTVGETFTAAHNLYNYGRNLNAGYLPSRMTELASDIKNELIEAGYDAESAGNPFRNAAKIESLADSSKVPTPADLERIRKNLNLVAGDRKPLPNGGLTAEAAAAKRTIAAIDDFMANPHNVLGPDAEEAAQIYGHARELWSAASSAKELQNAVAIGEHRAGASGSGANIENTLRQEIRKTLDNPSRAARYSPQERAMMERIVMGDLPRNSARLLGKLAATGVVSAAGVSYLAHTMGFGMLGELAVPGVAYTVKKAGEAMTRQRINQLTQSILADSPLGRSRDIPAINVARYAPFAARAARGAQAVNQDAQKLLAGPNAGSWTVPALQGPATGRADEGQIDRPPSQQKAGSGVGQKPEFARGGQVFSPEAIGARRAKNGHFYIPDPNRPGKYMIVLPKNGAARARGGAVNHDSDKISKAAAHYRDRGYDDEKCARCRMMIWPHGCTAVAGQIKPGGVCALFEPKRKVAA